LADLPPPATNEPLELWSHWITLSIDIGFFDPPADLGPAARRSLSNVPPSSSAFTTSCQLMAPALQITARSVSKDFYPIGHYHGCFSTVPNTVYFESSHMHFLSVLL
jgi:hypothetical protein